MIWLVIYLIGIIIAFLIIIMLIYLTRDDDIICLRKKARKGFKCKQYFNEERSKQWNER